MSNSDCSASAEPPARNNTPNITIKLPRRRSDDDCDDSSDRKSKEIVITLNLPQLSGQSSGAPVAPVPSYPSEEADKPGSRPCECDDGQEQVEYDEEYEQCVIREPKVKRCTNKADLKKVLVDFSAPCCVCKCDGVGGVISDGEKEYILCCACETRAAQSECEEIKLFRMDGPEEEEECDDETCPPPPEEPLVTRAQQKFICEYPPPCTKK